MSDSCQIAQKNTVRVLVVDDYPDMVSLVEEILSDACYEVENALDGHECLEKLERFDPDVILLDIMMPGMSGWELLEQMKEHHICERAKVIVIAANALTEEDLRRKEFAKVVAYLRKPFFVGELLDELDSVLDGEG